MESLPRYYSKTELVKELKKARPYFGLTYLQVLKLGARGIYRPSAIVGNTPLYKLDALDALIRYVDNPPTVYGKAWKTRKEAKGKADQASQ